MRPVNQIIMGAVQAAVTYATLSPTDKKSDIVLSGGNLTATSGGTTGFVRSTIGKSAGKWYWEVSRISVGANGGLIGIARSTTAVTNSLGITVTGARDEFGWWESSTIVYSNGATAGTTISNYGGGSLIGIALDMDNKTLKFYLANVLQCTITGLSANTFFAAVGYYVGGYTANFGATALAYSPPAGYNAGLYN